MEETIQIAVVEISKLSLEPGDILIVRTPDNWNANAVHETVNHVMRQAGVHAPVLIGTKDVEFSVLKAPDAPKEA